MTIKAQAPETTQFFFLTLLLRNADMCALSQSTLNRKNLKKRQGKVKAMNHGDAKQLLKTERSASFTASQLASSSSFCL